MPARYHLSTMALQYNNCTIVQDISDYFLLCNYALQGPIENNAQVSLSQSGQFITIGELVPRDTWRCSHVHDD